MISTENVCKEIIDAISSPLEDEAKKLPDKSRSLRARSIQKRLETERNKNFPKGSIVEQQQKDIISNMTKSQSPPILNSRSKKRGGGRFGLGSTTMSKYRRKTANAKERDRMKTVNEAFEKLKSVVPVDELLQQQQQPASVLLPKETENNISCDASLIDGTTGKGLMLGLVNPLKSTKVSTLRCAIEYINALQKLIEDSEKGILDPSFYENDEDDNDEDIDMILERHVPFNGDNNNNRDKKKRGIRRRRGKDKHDTNGKKFLSNKKMSMIASSLNKNLSVKKLNGRIKIHNPTDSKQVEKGMFEVKKMLKMGSNGSTCLNPGGKKHGMNIINASIPQIMDIIRNATAIDGTRVKTKINRKKPKLANANNRRENSNKPKSRNGKFLQMQKRVENIPQLLTNIRYASKKFQLEPKSSNLLTIGPNGTVQSMLPSSQHSPNTINNIVQYIQPIGENQDMKYAGNKTTSNLPMLVSYSQHVSNKPSQLRRNKFSGGLSNNLNISNANCIQNLGVSPATNVYEKDSLFLSKTNKLSPPQVKKLLSSLLKFPIISEPLINTSPPPPIIQTQPSFLSSVSPSIPVNSTILLSPPPSNSSCSNYSCDETSTTSSFDDVNTTNSNVDSNIDTSSCLISPSLNSFLSSSSLHTNMPFSYQSTVGSSGLNTSLTSVSPSTSSSSSEVQLTNCSNSCTMDILDDIQQVLKDAENFDILFA